jgi:hypothetical protein
LIKQTNGRIFNVEFYKKDGSLRKMTARIGVRKHLVGGRNNTSHISKYITVYDMVKYGYRTVNIDTVVSLQVNGSTYLVD